MSNSVEKWATVVYLILIVRDDFGDWGLAAGGVGDTWLLSALQQNLDFGMLVLKHIPR